MGQSATKYGFRNRTLDTGNNRNNPELLTLNDDLLQTTLQHVVMTFDQTNGRRIYVNGQFTGDIDATGPGSLTNIWNPNYPFIVGNESTDNRLWKGDVHFAAVFNQALTPQRVAQNFNADLGQTYLLQFDVSTWVGTPGSYIEMEVREFDAFSYLLAKPTFFGPNPNNIPVKNIRIAVNGDIPVAAQAFSNVDAFITSNGQLLSPQGSVIPKQLGVEQDGFSLTFDVLGDFQMNVELENVVLAPVQFVNEQLPELGLRNFDQINNTTAALTGVDPNTTNIRETYEELRQQLPADYDLRNIASAHQVAHFKMALEYAQTLVASDQLRDAFFGFSFNPDTAFSVNQGQTDAIVIQIVNTILNINLANQPNAAEVSNLLKGLIAQLPDDKTALAAAIATVLSSAAALII